MFFGHEICVVLVVLIINLGELCMFVLLYLSRLKWLMIVTY